MRQCGTQADMEGFLSASCAKVSRVSNEYMDEVWPMAAPFIRSAFRQDTTENLEQIRDKIENYQYQLWIAMVPEIICAVVTMLIDRKHEVVLHVEYGGAYSHTIELWKDPLAEALEEFAKQYGAKALECAGRVGWTKVFPEAKIISVKSRKEL